MKKPTFFEGVAVAFIASIGTSVIYAALAPMFYNEWIFRVLIAGGALAYILYLLTRCDDRVGRITTIAVWTIITVATWWLYLPIELFGLMHLGLIWLVRSLYFYTSVFSALMDFGLNGLSLATAIWAAVHSGNIFLSVWCFFLMQALFVTIPPNMRRSPTNNVVGEKYSDNFQRAHQVAESAIKKLSSSC